MLLFLLRPEAISAREMDLKRDSIISGNDKRIPLLKAVAVTSAYYVGSISLLNNTWYKDKKRVAFHFSNDSKGYLQVDKFGHMFGAYLYSYVGYHLLLEVGTSRRDALVFGSSLGFILQFPIEIMDGLHEGYGFSWGDVAANSLGAALVGGQELLFGEQIVKYKFSYWESDYARNSNNYYGKTKINRLLKDYNGHTYWFSMPLNRLWKKDCFPPWLSVAVGYGANGMYGEFHNITSYNGAAIPSAVRYRQYLFSLDIDWTRIETNSRFLELVFKGMTFVKFPFPTLEINSKRQVKGYWIYY